MSKTATFTCRLAQYAPWRVASWWPLSVTRKSEQNGRHHEPWSSKRTVVPTVSKSATIKFQESPIRPVIRSVLITTRRFGARGEVFQVPSEFFKIEFKCHHNDTSTRAVFLNTCRVANRIDMPLILQICAPKSELLELSSNYQVEYFNTDKTKTVRIAHYGTLCLSVVILLGLTFWSQEAEVHQYGHLHGPYWSKRLVFLAVFLYS